jgi:hypothetical protein
MWAENSLHRSGQRPLDRRLRRSLCGREIERSGTSHDFGA